MSVAKSQTSMVNVNHDSLKVAKQCASSGTASGWLRRGLACDAEVRHSGARSHRLRAVVGAARLHGELCVTCQHTSSQPPFAGLLVILRNNDDMGDGVPTDQLSHNHCESTDRHCRSHIVASCAFVLLARPNRYQKTTTAGTFHTVYFTKQLDTSKPCVFLSRHISQSYPPRASS